MDRGSLSVGQSAERDFVVSDETVRAFAEVSQDRNPVHLDEDYAARTVFRGRVAHGMILGGYISAMLGQDLPGAGSIYVSQTLRFLHPVRIGDTVHVRVEVSGLSGASATLIATCSVGDRIVATGEAVVMPPRQRRARSEPA